MVRPVQQNLNLELPCTPKQPDDSAYAFHVPRIVVIGNSGSGKTTLASRISEQFDIPHVELDAIFHQANWTPLSIEEFSSRTTEATTQSDWVVCGNYSTVREIIWERADTIIAIDLPKWLNMARVVRRTARRAIRREVLWNNNRESFRNVMALHDKERSIIRWSWTMHRRMRDEIDKALVDPRWENKRFIIVKNRVQADEVVEMLRTPR